MNRQQTRPGSQPSAKEEQMLCGRLLDLAQTCYQRDHAAISDFLTLNEQDIFLSRCVNQLPPVTYELTGGYEGAERKAVLFQPTGAWSIDYPAPLAFIQVKPKNRRFAQELSHRDYLGALMSLGLERSRIGDILIMEEGCVIVSAENIADFICEQLTKIRNTEVSCIRQDREEFSYQPKVRHIDGTVASVRLDAVIGLAFSASRSKLTGYIEGEKVFVNGKCITSNAYQLKEGDLVSVRGLGKFRFLEEKQKTKKGRTAVALELFV